MTSQTSSGDSGSFVLDAMNELERDDFEIELADSETLRNEVTELTDTAVLLGLAVDPVTPSPGLKENIMARLNQTPQLEREDPPVRALRPLAVLPKERAAWYRRPAFALAASAAAVLIAGCALAANVALQSSANSARADALAEITTASDVRQVRDPVATGGQMTLMWSLHLKKAAVIAQGLPVLQGGKAYELWYINAGKPTPAGMFESDGKNSYIVLSGDMVEGATVAVTIEPSGGSKAPTSKPVVAISST